MDTIEDCDINMGQLPSEIFAAAKGGIDSCWKGFDGDGFTSRESGLRSGDDFSLGNSPRESPRHQVTYAIDEMM